MKRTNLNRAYTGHYRRGAFVYECGRLRLCIDGRAVAESTTFNPADYDLSNDQPLRIGFGVGHPIRRAMSDLRLYNRALTAHEVAHLS